MKNKSFDFDSSHECCDNLVSHEDVDKDASEEGESSAGLGDDVEVDNGVQDPGADKDSEERECYVLG